MYYYSALVEAEAAMALLGPSKTEPDARLTWDSRAQLFERALH